MADKGATIGAVLPQKDEPLPAAECAGGLAEDNTPVGATGGSGNEFAQIVAAVEARVLANHPARKEVGGAVGGTEAIHRASICLQKPLIMYP